MTHPAPSRPPADLWCLARAFLPSSAAADAAVEEAFRRSAGPGRPNPVQVAQALIDILSEAARVGATRPGAPDATDLQDCCRTAILLGVVGEPELWRVRGYRHSPLGRVRLPTPPDTGSRAPGS